MPVFQTLTKCVVFTVLIAGLWAAGPLVAGDAACWPQFHGPRRDNRSIETGLLQSWPDDGPPLAWSAEGLGGGFSSVAVVGDRIYTMGDLGDAQYAIALKRDGGAVVWKTKVGPAWKDKYLGPRSTPTVDGDLLYAV